MHTLSPYAIRQDPCALYLTPAYMLLRRKDLDYSAPMLWMQPFDMVFLQLKQRFSPRLEQM